MKLPYSIQFIGYDSSDAGSYICLKLPDGTELRAGIKPEDLPRVRQLTYTRFEFGTLTSPTTVQMDFGELEFPEEKFHSSGFPHKACPGEPVQVTISRDGEIQGVLSLLDGPPPVKASVEKRTSRELSVNFTPPNPEKWVPAAVKAFQKMVQRSVNALRELN